MLSNSTSALVFIIQPLNVLYNSLAFCTQETVSGTLPVVSAASFNAGSDSTSAYKNQNVPAQVMAGGHAILHSGCVYYEYSIPLEYLYQIIITRMLTNVWATFQITHFPSLSGRHQWTGHQDRTIPTYTILIRNFVDALQEG